MLHFVEKRPRTCIGQRLGYATTFWMTTVVIHRLLAETTSALGSLIHNQAWHSGDTGRANDHVQTKMHHQWHALFGRDGKAQYGRVDSNPRSIGSLLYSNSWNPVTDLSPEANLVVVVVVVDMWCLCADVRGDERFVQGNTGLFAKDLKQRPSLFSAGQCATP